MANLRCDLRVEIETKSKEPQVALYHIESLIESDSLTLKMDQWRPYMTINCIIHPRRWHHRPELTLKEGYSQSKRI